MTKILDVASQPQLAEILRAIEQGDDVILTRDGRVIAEVKPSEESVAEKPKERVLGLGAGEGYYMADDFDAELPDSFWLGEE